MKRNVGTVDKWIRIPLGIIILALGFYFQSLWGLIGIIPLISGLAGFCPLYGVFGLSSCKAPEATTPEY